MTVRDRAEKISRVHHVQASSSLVFVLFLCFSYFFLCFFIRRRCCRRQPRSFSRVSRSSRPACNNEKYVRACSNSYSFLFNIESLTLDSARSTDCSEGRAETRDLRKEKDSRSFVDRIFILMAGKILIRSNRIWRGKRKFSLLYSLLAVLWFCLFMQN